MSAPLSTERRKALRSHARALIEARQFSPARAVLRLLVELGDVGPEVLLNLAMLEAELREDERAQALVEKAEKLMALLGEPPVALTRLLHRTRQWLPGGPHHPKGRAGPSASAAELGWSGVT